MSLILLRSLGLFDANSHPHFADWFMVSQLGGARIQTPVASFLLLSQEGYSGHRRCSPGRLRIPLSRGCGEFEDTS